LHHILEIPTWATLINVPFVFVVSYFLGRILVAGVRFSNTQSIQDSVTVRFQTFAVIDSIGLDRREMN